MAKDGHALLDGSSSGAEEELCGVEDSRPRAATFAARALLPVVAATIAIAMLVVSGSKVHWGIDRRAVSQLDEEQECFAGGQEELTLTLPAFDDKEAVIPTIPVEPEAYSYAAESALIAIPLKCTEEFKDKIADHTTLTDRSGNTGMAYFYLKDLEGGWETVAKFKDCSCGLVIEMHGSGGPGWTAVQFAALFSGMGYTQIILNSMAMPEEMGLKGKLPLKDIGDIDTSNFCGSYNAFEGSCSKFSKPFCYSTKKENVLHDPDNYRKYVEGIYEIRKRELDWFVENTDAVFGLTKEDWPLFLVGNSEGAMAASRYHHVKLDSLLAGRIITAWSCEFNYYVSCADHAKLCEDKCDKSVPQLNVIGDKDEYFGPIKSVSKDVAEADNGYGGPITGNCRKQYDAQEFETSTVVVMEDSYHGPSYYNDNTWRNVLADFLTNQGDAADSWTSLSACTLADGVYSCPKDGPTTCKTVDGKYQVNPSSTFTGPKDYSCPVAE